MDSSVGSLISRLFGGGSSPPPPSIVTPAVASATAAAAAAPPTITPTAAPAPQMVTAATQPGITPPTDADAVRTQRIRSALAEFGKTVAQTPGNFLQGVAAGAGNAAVQYNDPVIGEKFAAINRANLARPLIGKALSGDQSAAEQLKLIDPNSYMETQKYNLQDPATQSLHMQQMLFGADTPEKWQSALDLLTAQGVKIPNAARNFSNKDAVVGQWQSIKDQLEQRTAGQTYQMNKLQIAQAQRTADAQKGLDAQNANLPPDMQTLWKLDPEGMAKATVAQKYPAIPGWGVVRKNAFGQDIMGYPPVRDPTRPNEVQTFNQDPMQPVSSQQSTQAQQPPIGQSGPRIAPPNPMMADAQPTAAAAPAQNVPKTSKTYMDQNALGALPPEMRADVIAIGRNDAKLNDVINARGGMRGPWFNAVRTVFPNWNEEDYAARQAFQKSAQGDGQFAQKGVQFNTAINHMGQLQDYKDQIGKNWNFDLANMPGNWWAEHFGNSAQSQYNDLHDAGLTEVGKALKGQGVLDSDSVARQLQTINKNMPDEQHIAATQTKTAQVLGEKILAMRDEYRNSMNGAEPPNDLLDPQARATLYKLGIDPKTMQIVIPPANLLALRQKGQYPTEEDINSAAAGKSKPTAAQPAAAGKTNGILSGKTTTGTIWSFQ